MQDNGQSIVKRTLSIILVLVLVASTQVVSAVWMAVPMLPAAGVSPLVQLREVMAKLKELNPEFDGREMHRFEGGMLTELSFSSAGVKDISPLRVLTDLRKLSCRGTPQKRTLSDLSPLQGMMLTELDVRDTGVSDLSPLKSMPLKELRCDLSVAANKESVRLLVEKQMLQKINGVSVAEFVQVANMTVTKRAAEAAKEVERAAEAFITSTSMLPPERQVAVVMAKLKELNPKFDGRETHRVQRNVVTDLAFSTVGVTKLWPIRAMKWLKNLTLSPWLATEKGTLSNLSELQGMQLIGLYCHNNPIRDLSPLKGMPLVALTCGGSQVDDLSPLAGMKLTLLSCNDTAISSLSSLEGMPMTVLWCNNTKVTDLSPLRAMPLKEVRCDFVAERDAANLRGVKTLTKINDTPAGVLWIRLEAAGQLPNKGR